MQLKYKIEPRELQPRSGSCSAPLRRSRTRARREFPPLPRPAASQISNFRFEIGFSPDLFTLFTLSFEGSREGSLEGSFEGRLFGPELLQNPQFLIASAPRLEFAAIHTKQRAGYVSNRN
jgi:hypothetical protein